MRPDTQLDYAIFQLTPNRDRCELYVVAQGQTYKLASGLLNPFLAHLRTAEEQIAQGGQSIRLEPPDPRSASWFTKGTVERFVRFVSTPEVLERVSTIEIELMEVAEAIRTQASDGLEETQTAEDHLSTKTAIPSNSSGGSPHGSSNLEQIAKAQELIDDSKSGLEENTKRWLLRALDARQMMLQKEQEMAFGRAIAAGFTFRHVGDLVFFAERFGANRLREACIKFMAFCQKRKESGMWLEDIDPASVSSCQNQPPSMGGGASANSIKCLRPKEYPEAWTDIQGREAKALELRRASFPIEGGLITGVNGAQNLTREGSIDGDRWPAMARMGYAHPLMWPVNRQVSAYGMNQLPTDNMQAGGLGNPEHRKDLGQGGIPDTERGPPWQGQSHYFQGNPLHRSIPSAASPPIGFPIQAQFGSAYPQSFDNLCMHPAYIESNKWQLHAASAAPVQYYPGNQVDSRSQPIVNGKEMNADQPNKEKVALRTESTPTQGEEHEGSQLISQRADGVMVREDTNNLLISSASSKELVSDKLVEVMDDKEEISKGSQMPSHLGEDQMHKNNQETSQETCEEPIAETTRRFPRRASSPSRRSVSPMRKVQIARSGFRRTGSFAKRCNYSVQDEHSVVDDTVESSEDEIEGNEDVHKNLEATQDKAEPFRVRVQDVIGLFESKKEDNSDVRKQLVKKEGRRLPSKNPVLSRWNENGSRSERQTDASIEEDISKRESRASTVAEKETSNDAVGNATAGGHDEHGTIHQEISNSHLLQEGNFSADKRDSSSLNASQDLTTGSQCLEQTLGDSFITSESDLKVETCDAQKVDENNDHLEDAEAVQDDGRPNQEKTILTDDKSKNFENGLHDTDAKEKNGTKTIEREVKAKAMQEMLERRKAGAVKSSKPIPLVAIAQSRAEKLRAYKAGLQQSKKEKEERERKRIEDLKNQRRERMAARNNIVVASPETTVKKIVQTPSPSGSRLSPTAHHKPSNSSPQDSVGGAATLSPTSVAKKKIPGGKKPSRVSPKTSENILSQSVPSFTDLKKENLKTTSTVRASTGSQRFSQLKKSVKDDADGASPLKASNAEEKKRPLSTASVRKGIPPARDTKVESLPSQKVTKVSSSATKPQKKTASIVKSSEKAAATENGKVANEVKTVDVSSAVDPVVGNETKKDVTEEIDVKLTEVDITAAEVDVPVEDMNSSCTKNTVWPSDLDIPANRSFIDVAMSNESTDNIEDLKDAPCEHESSLQGNISTGSDLNQTEASTAFPVPDAPLPYTNGDLDAVKVENVHVDESPAKVDLPSDEPPVAVPEQCDPRTFAIDDTPSKNLPRLHEAIQQAHSPEVSLGSSKSKKKQSDNGSQKVSKDHQAKGLKRLLFLGRKSSRNTAPNFEANEDTDNAQVNATKHSKNEVTNSSSVRSNVKSQGDEATSGSSSSKGSRSFFSLALRGKGDGR